MSRTTVVVAGLVLGLLGSPAAGQESADPSFPLSKGGKHLVGISAGVGATAASVVLIASLTAGANQNLVVGAASTVGMLALFLGGGLSAGHLLEPTPPMAWSSFFCGAAGAGLGLGLILTVSPAFGPGAPSAESMILAMALGYVVAAGIDLALPGRDTIAWKDFWLPMMVAIIPGATLIVAGSAANAFRSTEFTVLAMAYPVASFLVTRAILSSVQPFDPWVDDLEIPFTAEPFITLSPSGATVGFTANW